jgi:hypothetical protein
VAGALTDEAADLKFQDSQHTSKQGMTAMTLIVSRRSPDSGLHFHQHELSAKLDSTLQN